MNSETIAAFAFGALSAAAIARGIAARRARARRDSERELPGAKPSGRDSESARLQQALEEAQAKKEWYSLVLRSISEEVYFTDIDKHYTYANAAVLREFGHDGLEGVPVEHILRNLEVLRPDGSPRPIEEAPPLRALAGEIVRNEEQIVRNPRTGELRHRQVSSAPVRNRDGTIIGSVSVARDITERKRVEQALREADRRKDVFIATLSHELRNPLAPIRTAAKMLEAPQLGEAQRMRCAAIIGRQVSHLGSLLDDLLDISRLSRGEFSLQRKDVSLKSVVDAALEAAEPALAAKRHHLTLAMPPDPLTIHVDPVRFTQIMSNLLTNAARYTDPGGEISLAVELDDQALQIAVTDNGIGLAPETQAQIFEMFVRLDAAKQHREGGLGIGLALVKALVEMHGGQVSVHSAGVNRGSSFSVRMPRSAVLVTSQPGRDGVASQIASGRKRRVLVADDNADGADSIAMLLETQGHEVGLARDGHEAVAVADRMHPDVALLDIGMPGLDGYEVARSIRSRPWGRATVLIAMTGWGRDQDRRAAVDAGFDRHLTKPIDLDALRTLLAQGSAVRRDQPIDPL